MHCTRPGGMYTASRFQHSTSCLITCYKSIDTKQQQDSDAADKAWLGRAQTGTRSAQSILQVAAVPAVFTTCVQ